MYILPQLKITFMKTCSLTISIVQYTSVIELDVWEREQIISFSFFWLHFKYLLLPSLSKEKTLCKFVHKNRLLSPIIPAPNTQ